MAAATTTNALSAGHRGSRGGSEATQPRSTALPASALARRLAGSFGISVLFAAALLVADAWSIFESAERALVQRLAADAATRADALGIVLKASARRAEPALHSDLLRLVAARLAQEDARQPDADHAWLKTQVPFARGVLAALVKSGELHAAAVLDLQGHPQLSVGRPPPPPHTDGWRDGPIFGPLRIETAPHELRAGEPRHVWLDVYQPLFLPHERAGARGGEPSAILAATLPARRLLAAILASARDGVGIWLAQAQPNGEERLQIEPALLLPPLSRQKGASLVELLAGEEPAPLVATAAVEATSFEVVAAAPAESLLVPLGERLKITGPLALGLILTMTSGLVWRRQGVAGRDARTAAIESAAPVVNTAPKANLRDVLGALSDPVLLIDEDGLVTCANLAFCEHAGCPAPLDRPLDELPGTPLVDELRVLASEVRNGKPDAEVTLELGGAGRMLSAHGLADGRGVLLISRPQLGSTMARKELAARNHALVRALIHAIELRDPFLLGHTERLRQLAEMVGRRMGVDEDALVTLDLAAALSQIGKVFVPDAVLNKHGRHDAEETRLTQIHIQHAAEIFEPLDFGLPVREVLLQIHERLDGSGYPKGLSGGLIGPLARILGVVDVFVARTAARAYRRAVAPGQVLYHLARQPERYDGCVVAALAAVVADESWRPTETTTDPPAEAA